MGTLEACKRCGSGATVTSGNGKAVVQCRQCENKIEAPGRSPAIAKWNEANR